MKAAPAYAAYRWSCSDFLEDSFHAECRAAGGMISVNFRPSPAAPARTTADPATLHHRRIAFSDRMHRTSLRQLSEPHDCGEPGIFRFRRGRRT